MFSTFKCEWEANATHQETQLTAFQQLTTKIGKKKRKKAELNWNTDKTEFPVIWKKRAKVIFQMEIIWIYSSVLCKTKEMVIKNENQSGC